MKKRLFAVVMMLTIAFTCIAPAALAADDTRLVQTERIDFEDGSYCIITIEEDTVMALASTGTNSGNKVYSYYDSDGNINWVAVLNGTFSYTSGVSSTCTNASCSVSIYENEWYTISKSASKSGNTAYATVVMGRKVLGIKVSEETAYLTLTCDSYGNLS
ncbi:MAG: hypothetical protein ACI3VB_02090 [Oscillospiraceae bacterium]